MNNISIDAALKLLPTGSKSLPLDEGRLPAFGDHLDRARAERTEVMNCPSPPPTPTVCRAAPRDSNKPAGEHGGSDDAKSRNDSNVVVEEAPREDGPQHEEEQNTADEVEISAAAAGAVAPGTADSRSKKSSATTDAEVALKAAHQQPSDVTAADAAAAAKTKLAGSTPTANANLAANAEANAAAELPLDKADVTDKATRHTRSVKQTAEALGDKIAQAAHKRLQPTATAANQAATVGKDAAQNAVVKAATDSTAAGTGAAEVVAVAPSPSANRPSDARREPAVKQNQVTLDSTSPFTQILVSAEASAAGTSVVTADRKGDSVDWTTSVTNEEPAPASEPNARADAPREVGDAGPRPTASPQLGETRSTHPGRLEGIPVAGRPGTSEIHDQISQADRVRLVQRVARALQSATERGGEVRLRLSPPELGSLRMEVIVQHGQLSAHIEAETSAAKSVLLDNLPALRSRLAEQDITVARFDVDVMDNPAEGNHQQYDQDGDWSRQGSGVRTNDATRQRTENVEPTKSPRTTTGSTGELNIVV